MTEKETKKPNTDLDDLLALDDLEHFEFGEFEPDAGATVSNQELRANEPADVKNTQKAKTAKADPEASPQSSPSAAVDAPPTKEAAKEDAKDGGADKKADTKPAAPIEIAQAQDLSNQGFQGIDDEDPLDVAGTTPSKSDEETAAKAGIAAEDTDDDIAAAPLPKQKSAKKKGSRAHFIAIPVILAIGAGAYIYMELNKGSAPPAQAMPGIDGPGIDGPGNGTGNAMGPVLSGNPDPSATNPGQNPGQNTAQNLGPNAGGPSGSLPAGNGQNAGLSTPQLPQISGNTQTPTQNLGQMPGGNPTGAGSGPAGNSAGNTMGMPGYQPTTPMGSELAGMMDEPDPIPDYVPEFDDRINRLENRFDVMQTSMENQQESLMTLADNIGDLAQTLNRFVIANPQPTVLDMSDPSGPRLLIDGGANPNLRDENDNRVMVRGEERPTRSTGSTVNTLDGILGESDGNSGTAANTGNAENTQTTNPEPATQNAENTPNGDSMQTAANGQNFDSIGTRPARPAQNTEQEAPAPAANATNTEQTDRDANRILQTHLAQLGHYHGAIDGIIGPQSTRAITSFQEQLGEEESGTLTTAQRTRLANLARFAAPLDESRYRVAAAPRNPRPSAARQSPAQRAVESTGRPDPAPDGVWDVRAATNGAAWLQRRNGAEEFLQVRIGDRLEGYGRIIDIRQHNGQWEVIGENGRISG